MSLPIIRNFPVELTEAELIERGEEMSKCVMNVVSLKIERSGLNKKIKPLEIRTEELAGIIESGIEHRDIECVWQYDWRTNLRHLIRTDTGEVIDTSIIPPDKKQMDMFTYDLAAEEIGMFAGCPEDPAGCPHVKVGNACAPILCGKNLAPLQRVTVVCRHPEDQRVIESNAVSCGVCKTVLEVSEVTRQLQPEEAEEQKCCQPFHLDTSVKSEVRFTYCRVCGRLHRKALLDQTPIKIVEVLPGEKVDLETIKGAA
jgi:hypothetical protein